MPEEKKENKAAAKDSFTFSDKIKNSKPAGSKSFANRISSKIGSDGKPKKTLFERTKRDAPFFIAAIVALLLLPFLYKYSGSVGEEPTMVTPGSEETMFDPTRSGFDGIGDPEGQIAQLAGRDSMDLIVGFGKKKEVEESDDFPSRSDWGDRSGLDDSYSSKNNSEEYNTTNVYRQRKQAAPATRAAFKKTPINSLRGAGLASRSGGKLGVGMWGGGLKKAADKVKGDAPKSSPKPVSLQPLQAAGKPSRSYFGQGAAAEARRSKDAMSKANAMQALMDAQMKPIEPGKIGGIGGGDFGGPGGGNGNLERKFAFNGKEPWWWDMMKQRSQMEWEKKFNYKWGWIDWATGLAQKLADGLLSCLITGTDDWSMGKIGGSIAGAGDGEKCGELDEEGWNNCPECVNKYGKFNKKNCKNYLAHLNPESSMVKKGWQGSTASSSDLNFFQARWDCLTNGAFDARKARKAGEGKIGNEDSDCTDFYAQGHYRSSVSGDYKLFHYVVGVEEENWKEYVAKNSDDKRKDYLSIGYVGEGGSFSIDSNEMTQVMNERKFIPLFIESVAIKSKKVNTQEWNGKVSYNGYFNLGNKKGQCGAFKDIPYEQAVQMCKAKKPRLTCRRDCLASINAQAKGRQKATSITAAEGMGYNEFFDMLREGGIMRDSAQSLYLSAKGGKEGKDWSTGARCAYPLAFVSCHHNAQETGAQTGETDEAGRPVAFLTFPNVGQLKKNGASNFYQDVLKRFTVIYKVGDRLAGGEKYSSKGYFAQQVGAAEGYAGNTVSGPEGQTLPVGDKKYNVAAAGKGLAAINEAMGASSNGRETTSVAADKSATVTWEVRQCWDDEVPWRYGRAIEDGACGRTMNSLADGVDGSQLPGQIVSTATCVYGDEITVSARKPDDTCESDQDSERCCTEKHPANDYKWENGQCVQKCPNGKNTSEACCRELGESNDRWHDGECSPLPPEPECPEGQETNLACCEKVSGFHWDENHTPNKCVSNDPIPTGSSRLAHYIAWIPSGATDRQPIEGSGAPSASSFGRTKAVQTQNDTQHCGGNVGSAVMDSTAAQTFVQQVVAKYNEKYPQNPISYTADLPRVGEFVDALNIAASAEIAIGQVEKSAVCELGRRMIDVSRDPDVNDASFRNELGAFYAYIHEAAVLYPSMFYGSADTCDKRFLAYKERECSATSGLAHYYHHNNYTFAGDRGEAGIRAYNASLPAQVKEYPLAELVQGISFDGLRTCRNKRNRTSCGAEVRQYDQTFSFLVNGSRDSQESGQACSSLSGKMSVANALKYVKTSCKLGLDLKPHGAGDGDSGGSGGSVSGGGGSPNPRR